MEEAEEELIQVVEEECSNCLEEEEVDFLRIAATMR